MKNRLRTTKIRKPHQKDWPPYKWYMEVDKLVKLRQKYLDDEVNDIYNFVEDIFQRPLIIDK